MRRNIVGFAVQDPKVKSMFQNGRRRRVAAVNISTRLEQRELDSALKKW